MARMWIIAPCVGRTALGLVVSCFGWRWLVFGSHCLTLVQGGFVGFTSTQHLILKSVTTTTRWRGRPLEQQQARRRVVTAATDLHTSKSFSSTSPSRLTATAGLRLNKAFGATHSRRQADALIASGRVTVNGVDDELSSLSGRRLLPGDIVRLDGNIIEWENLIVLQPNETTSSSSLLPKMAVQQPPARRLDPQQQSQQHEYIKYWKPKGVTCTCDRRVVNNILDAVEQSTQQGQGQDNTSSLIRRRIFPVGRLDKDSTGLILLTSDGRIPNVVLNQTNQQPKTYHVTVDRPISQDDLSQLRQGVIITNEYARVVPTSSSQGNHNRNNSEKVSTEIVRKSFQARTLPAQVRFLPSSAGHRKYKEIEITIVEGRNRQIRKMLSALQYTVIELHRVAFMGITLQGLQQPGDWLRLSAPELQLLFNRTSNSPSL